MPKVSIRRSDSEAAEQFRWNLTGDADPQDVLFPGLVERETGRGEFRGLEFLHVEAKSIINEVPAAAGLPFRYTINPYRGCSHACAYCMPGDTPILMGDGRTRPLAELQSGDIVYGTERRGAYRRYVRTQVLDHWSTVKPAYRVALADGTELVASADHRFLSDRGWKHVIGAEQGPLQRPHLTENNRLIGVGHFAQPPKHDEDYRRGYLAGMIRGDGTIGAYMYRRPGGGVDARTQFRLALADYEALSRTQRYLADAGVHTDEFLFEAASAKRREVRAIRTQRGAMVARIEDLIWWPIHPSTSWRKGFLAGIFDAEGSCSRGIWRLSNTDPTIIDWVEDCLEEFGFRSAVELQSFDDRRDIATVRMKGGFPEVLRFFHTFDPAITRKCSIEGRAVKNQKRLQVTAVEPLGFEVPMFDITTGTGDFIANGVVSHNCFARPTHEYLNLDIGADFDSKIVVKVNAVERLRAELAPKRWAGEPIAMGTNTDPYQRAEGKYRLTRGVVETLAEFANPFSILTKSTLILRDLDVLLEAAEQADVATNFSVGTLDEAVWKLTEPGTPHPMRRIEAVAKLNEAGIPCGVLVAPVIPGLSDAPEQLDAVVAAAVDAGATPITPITLHLRPKVREHFLGWLREQRPDLLRRYREIYGRRRSYASEGVQQTITDRVMRAVERHGGLPAQPPPLRRGRRDPEPVDAPESEPQLSLGL